MIVGQYTTNVITPPLQLYRYMMEEHVDHFLGLGKLRLGSFKKYRTDEHPEIGDSSEGISQIQVHAKNYFTHKTIKIYDNSYMLCATSILSKELQDNFDKNSCIVISDVNEFAADIAKNIPGCRQVLHGPCIYQNILTHYAPETGLSDKPNKEEIDRLSAYLETRLQYHPYFHKFVEYSDQFEYRFLFITDRETHEHIDIECKSAPLYCQKINLPSP